MTNSCSGAAFIDFLPQWITSWSVLEWDVSGITSLGSKNKGTTDSLFLMFQLLGRYLCFRLASAGLSRIENLICPTGSRMKSSQKHGVAK